MSDPTIEQVQPGTIIEENVSFEDFVRRYEDQRVEWHAGKVVPQVTNNTIHNLIQHFLGRVLSWYLEELDAGIVVTAGVPMYIADNVPAREPDLMVILNENMNRLEAHRVNGAADIAVEIVSPGSSSADHGAKLIEYEAAGVREYWLIDPLRKLADVYELDNDGLYSRIEGDSRLLTSNLLRGFSLEKTILWREELPKGSEIVRLVEAMQQGK